MAPGVGVVRSPRGRSSPSRDPGKVEVHMCAVPVAGPVPRPWAAVHVRVQPGRGAKCFCAAGHVIGRAGPGARGPSRPGARASGVNLPPGSTSLDPDTVRVGRPPGDREVQLRTRLRPFLIAGCRARVTRQSNPRPAASPPESPWFGSLGPGTVRGGRPSGDRAQGLLEGIRVGLLLPKAAGYSSSWKPRQWGAASESFQRPTSVQPQVPKPPRRTAGAANRTCAF